MIAKLTGRIESTSGDSAVIDVAGVGYLVYCSARTLDGLPSAGGTASLHVETHVREDHIHLYGFGTLAERDWFRLLTTVQGVGTRVALAILSALSADRLADALIAGDADMLTRRRVSGPGSPGAYWPSSRTRRFRPARPGPASWTAPGTASRMRSTTRSRRWSISATAGARPMAPSPRRPGRSAPRSRSRR